MPEQVLVWHLAYRAHCGCGTNSNEQSRPIAASPLQETERKVVSSNSNQLNGVTWFSPWWDWALGPHKLMCHLHVIKPAYVYSSIHLRKSTIIFLTVPQHASSIRYTNVIYTCSCVMGLIVEFFGRKRQQFVPHKACFSGIDPRVHVKTYITYIMYRTLEFKTTHRLSTYSTWVVFWNYM